MAKGKSRCIARLPGFWTGNAAWALGGKTLGGVGTASKEFPKRLWRGPLGVGRAEGVPRRPTHTAGAESRPNENFTRPEANRPGASCWQRNLGTAPALRHPPKQRLRPDYSWAVIPYTCSSYPTLVREFFNPLPRDAFP
jgi:hypothetical protein